jgi:hypothetical protein
LVLNIQRDYSINLSALFSPSLMLMGLVIGHLNFHAYPLSTPEALIALMVVAGIGALLGLIPALLGPTNLRAFILGLLLFFFLDLQFGANTDIQDLFSADRGLPVWALFTIGIGGGFVAFLAILSMREHIATIFITVFGAFFLSALLIPVSSMEFGKEDMARSSGMSSDAPPVVHLVLDGHIGIEGIPLDLPGGSETKAALLRFYEKWGFRLYGGAYSPYLMTLNSLSSMLDGVVSDKDLVNVEVGQRFGGAKRLIENKYFRTILESSRNIRVFQSDYVDYCDYAKAAVEFCLTYPVSSINAVAGAEFAAVAKARIILDSFFRRKNISGKFYGSFVERSFYSSVAVRDVFDTLRDDILANPRGNLFFGHLMLPHDPYVWDRQCRIRPDSRQWMNRRPGHTDLTTLGTPEYRKKAYADYFDQVHCVVQLLDNIFTSMNEAGLLRDATVIVHGDHGSRITIRDPIIAYRDQATKSDYIDSFSTLFAIRTPELEPGYSPELQPLPNLFAEHIFKLPAPMDEQILYLRKNHKVEGIDLMPVPMPDF